MKGIDNITNRILSEARENGSGILARAQVEANDITANFKQIASRDAEEIISKGKEAAKERELRLNGVAALEARKAGLKTKQELIGAAFRKAVEMLRAQSDEEYINTLAVLAKRAAQTGAEEVILSKSDREKYGERIISAANDELKKTKPDAKLTLADETREIPGGLILKSGDMEINAAFDMILDTLRREISLEVAEILFN